MISPINGIGYSMENTMIARSKMGASQNALEHEKNVNDIAAENTAASVSRTQDSDIAAISSINSTEKVLQEFQTMVLKNQIKTEDGIVTKILPQT